MIYIAYCVIDMYILLEKYILRYFYGNFSGDSDDLLASFAL